MKLQHKVEISFQQEQVVKYEKFTRVLLLDLHRHSSLVVRKQQPRIVH